MKTVSVHQPHYLPWTGYFHKIMVADVFVVLDVVQAKKNSFINRNKIKTKNGVVWLTAPVRWGGHLNDTIADLELAEQRWRKKHDRTIRQAYGSSPYFERVEPLLELLTSQDSSSFMDLAVDMLKSWLSELCIETEVVVASDLMSNLGLDWGDPSVGLADICSCLDATHYVAGGSAEGYLNPAPFDSSGVEILIQRYSESEYPQLHGDFVSNLAALDAFCNVSDPLDMFKSFANLEAWRR